MEIGQEITVLFPRPKRQLTVQGGRKVMVSQPKQGETDDRGHRGGQLQYAIFHEIGTGLPQMVVTAGNASRVQGRVV